MVYESTFKADFDELIFALRNKEYGAYKLRKEYKTYLSFAMWISIMFLVLVTIGPSFFKNEIKENTRIFPDEFTIDLKRAPSIEQEKILIDKIPPLKPTIKFTPPVVMPDALVHNQYIPTVDELENVLPGIETREGVKDGYDQTLIENQNLIVENKPKEDIYVPFAEELPLPIGGIAAIQEKVIYPEIAKKAGIQGKVIIRAFIDETGKVTKAEVLKGIGGGCDEAAIDAVLKTKFNPGRQGGNPVKVQMSIPIVFKLK